MAEVPKDIMPVGLLMKEHRLIEKMVMLIREKVQAYKGSGKPEDEFIIAVVDFFSTYADRNHHGKEEEILFERLTKKDMIMKHKTTMETLLNDHVNGRKIIGRMRDLRPAFLENSPEAVDGIITQMQTLVDLYLNHIDIEDNHFFLQVMDYFDKAEQEKMLEDFIEFDQNIIHVHYRELVEDFQKGGESHA